MLMVMHGIFLMGLMTQWSFSKMLELRWLLCPTLTHA
uniref:Uncharacterized protein MANES_05G100300 n=1 Tax=Rhizophora mucronata TaxID=61149 RepID=A0A2P2N816_RHIMU